MAEISVDFVYHTGITRPEFNNVRLCGDWPEDGSWATTPMTPGRGDDGCWDFRASMQFPESAIGRTFRWGIVVDGPAGRNVWGIPTEVSEAGSTARFRTFVLAAEQPAQEYWLHNGRRFGATKLWRPDGSVGARFTVWAPNAQDVSVVFGDPVSGYIADDGTGIVGEPIPMTRAPEGIWVTDPNEPRLADFSTIDHTPYMYRVVKDDGAVAYRTDIYSRCQIGRGRVNPAELREGETFSGRREDLDGTVGCSVVVDADNVTELFSEPVWPEEHWLTQEEFWRDEFDPQRPLPTRVEDLVIYELHVGGLGAGRVGSDGTPIPGDLGDAVALLDHLSDLGVNAVELLPMAEFEGWASWGYGTSHYFTVEFSGGGRDQFKHFVRACHQRGIAVILDVVYNHFHHQAERAEWAYDSDHPERNIYYWYEGRVEDYPDPNGGYIDNLSTGWAPRLWEENVRKVFTSSMLMHAVEFHVDGFRVDQTTSLHAYAALHVDGSPAAAANAFGGKLLRELTRTVRLVKPSVILIAEDHSGWDAVTRPTDLDGLGFDATWFSEFYHNLAGDTGRGMSSANLITTAAYGDGRPLAMGRFAEVLRATSQPVVVYNESHDEAGNSSYEGGRSGRTLTIAAGRAPLVGDTRRYAEARARFAAGMAMLSAGAPMFFMGEEIGATEDYKYDDFVWHREDIPGAAVDGGANLFAFYRALIHLRRGIPALRSGALEILHSHDGNRVLAFRRAYGADDILVLASLNDAPFRDGYRFANVRDGRWREVFNSDSAWYGGWNEGNGGGDIVAVGGQLTTVLPRAGFVALRRVGNVPAGAG